MTVYDVVGQNEISVKMVRFELDGFSVSIVIIMTILDLRDRTLRNQIKSNQIKNFILLRISKNSIELMLISPKVKQKNNNNK